MSLDNKFKNTIFDFNNNFPIIITSNSSWYLKNYRSSLIEKLIKKNQKLLAISPIDKSSLELSKILPYIHWKLNRRSIFNPIMFLIFFLRMFIILLIIKPKLIHSHTLASNLICAVSALILGIPCVLSFAGLGKLYKEKGISNLILNIILKIIAYTSSKNSIFSSYKFKSNVRSILIFQNKKDLNYFVNRFKNFPTDQIFMIPGSGVPDKYIQFNKRGNLYWGKKLKNKLLEKEVEFIYCGRLLISKGINTFLSISKIFKENKFFVYGGVDLSQKDSLTEGKITHLRKKYPNVKFFGNKNDPFLRKELKVPILIVPSNYGEGLPRSILEALALGIPVICSKNSLCGIFSESHVYVSEGDNPDCYKDCVERIISEYASGKLFKKIKFSYEYILENLTEDSIVDKTINAYKKIYFNYAKSPTFEFYEKKTSSWIAD